MSEKATWLAVAVAVVGFGTAVVTNWDKLTATGTTSAKVTAPSNYLAYNRQAYITPQGGINEAFVKKWNADCVAEGQRQLQSHSFSIYNFNENSTAGGAQFPSSQELLMLIACNAIDQHLSYSVFAVGPSTEAPTVNQMIDAVMYGMKAPGMSFGSQ